MARGTEGAKLQPKFVLTLGFQVLWADIPWYVAIVFLWCPPLHAWNLIRELTITPTKARYPFCTLCHAKICPMSVQNPVLQHSARQLRLPHTTSIIAWSTDCHVKYPCWVSKFPSCARSALKLHVCCRYDTSMRRHRPLLSLSLSPEMSVDPPKSLQNSSWASLNRLLIVDRRNWTHNHWRGCVETSPNYQSLNPALNDVILNDFQPIVWLTCLQILMKSIVFSRGSASVSYDTYRRCPSDSISLSDCRVTRCIQNDESDIKEEP